MLKKENINQNNVDNILKKLEQYIPPSVHSQVGICIFKLEINTTYRLAHFLAFCDFKSKGFENSTKKDFNELNNSIIEDFFDDKENLDHKLSNFLQNFVTSYTFMPIKYPLVTAACTWLEKSANKAADLGISTKALNTIGRTFILNTDTIHARQELVNFYYNIIVSR